MLSPDRSMILCIKASFFNNFRSEGMTPVRIDDVCDTFISYYKYEQLGGTA